MSPREDGDVGAARDVHALCIAILPHLVVKKDEAKTIVDYLDERYGKDNWN